MRCQTSCWTDNDSIPTSTTIKIANLCFYVFRIYFILHLCLPLLEFNFLPFWFPYNTRNDQITCENAGKFQIGDNIKPLNPESVASIVEYSKVKSLKDQTQKAEGYSLIYSQLYPYKGLQNYTSGIIHHVQLKG